MSDAKSTVSTNRDLSTSVPATETVRPCGARDRCREEEGDRLRCLPGARLPRRRRRSILLESLRPRDALGRRTKMSLRALGGCAPPALGQRDRDRPLQVRFRATPSRRDRG